MSEEREKWKSKADCFAHAVGDEVIVFPPHAGCGIRGVVVEHIKRFTYPTGTFSTDNLIYVPSSRKWGTTTRKLSYLVKLKVEEGAKDLFLWAIKDCVEVEKMPP